MSFIKLSAIATDPSGRVVLSDNDLVGIERNFSPSAGGSTNMSCTNDFDCSGSLNSGCNNWYMCIGSTNQGTCNGRTKTPGPRN
jgi:hypothetical protein